MMLEKVEQFDNERRTRIEPILKALAELRRLQPPCARCRHQRATRVLGLAGSGQAQAGACADSAALDRRIAANRAAREAMRGRTA